MATAGKILDRYGRSIMLDYSPEPPSIESVERLVAQLTRAGFFVLVIRDLKQLIKCNMTLIKNMNEGMLIVFPRAAENEEFFMLTSPDQNIHFYHKDNSFLTLFGQGNDEDVTFWHVVRFTGPSQDNCPVCEQSLEMTPTQQLQANKQALEESHAVTKHMAEASKKIKGSRFDMSAALLSAFMEARTPPPHACVQCGYCAHYDCVYKEESYTCSRCKLTVHKTHTGALIAETIVVALPTWVKEDDLQMLQASRAMRRQVITDLAFMW